MIWVAFEIQISFPDLTNDVSEIRKLIEKMENNFNQVYEEIINILDEIEI